jgi:hypothetical protein
LLRTRLENQKLVDTTLTRPEEVVAALGAVQAQDFTGAKWALALRMKSATDDQIDQAFAAGRILRTHILRPTWHLVVPADIRWMLALNAARLRRMNLTYGRTLGLDERILTRARVALERVLEGGTALTRDELAAALRTARIHASGQRLAHLLFDLEQQAVICSGPLRGKKMTYMLLDERVPGGRELPRDEALGVLAGRYFRSHGPATIQDFAWWSGLTVRDARLAVDIAGVQPLKTSPGLQRAAAAHYLLPNYDEYFIAYKDRGAIVDPARARNLGVFTSREFPHPIIVDGRIAGSWRRTIAANGLTIELWPYETLSTRARAALGREANRYGRFLRVEVTCRLTSPSNSAA